MKKLIGYLLMGLALVVAIVYGFVITGDRNALNTELDSTKSELALTKAQLSSTEQSLASTQAELGFTKATLSSVQTELASTQNQLDTTKQTLTSTQAELSSTKLSLTSAQQASAKIQDSLSTTQKQLTVAQDTLGGLGITIAASKECYDVSLVDNSTATNPTWSQLLSFLSLDQTDKHAYAAGVYDCSQFSRDVHNNAEKAGIRAAEVQVKFQGETMGHALDAFLTTDYGLVYVDCTGGPDTFSRVKKGMTYRGAEIYSVIGKNARNDSFWDNLSYYYYLRSGTGGQVVTSSIKIYW